VEAMCNLLAILTPTAMRLLWLRQTAQMAPDTPATEVISKEVIQVVLHLDKRPKAQYCELKAKRGKERTGKFQFWHNARKPKEKGTF